MPRGAPYPARAELARQDLTITDLAYYIGVTRPHLTDVLNGRLTPPFPLAFLVSIVLQKPVSTMFPGVERPERRESDR